MNSRIDLSPVSSTTKEVTTTVSKKVPLPSKLIELESTKLRDTTERDKRDYEKRKKVKAVVLSSAARQEEGSAETTNFSKTIPDCPRPQYISRFGIQSFDSPASSEYSDEIAGDLTHPSQPSAKIQFRKRKRSDDQEDNKAETTTMAPLGKDKPSELLRGNQLESLDSRFSEDCKEIVKRRCLPIEDLNSSAPPIQKYEEEKTSSNPRSASKYKHEVERDQVIHRDRSQSHYFEYSPRSSSSSSHSTHHQREFMPRLHNFPMKGTIYLRAIKEGRKLYEGRVNGPACKKIRSGDQLKLFDRSAGWGILCDVTSVETFPDFKSMLEKKGVSAMLPQLADKISRLSRDELLREGVNIYQSFPGWQRVRDLGAVAIGVRYIQDITQ